MTVFKDRFLGKVALVTGCGSGIGEAVVRRLSAEGAQVVLAGHHLGKIKAVADSLPAERTACFEADVSKLDQIEHLVEFAVGRFGRLDVLINNAGVSAPGTLLEGPESDWRMISAVNIDGPLFLSRAALPHLIKTRGAIVNTASVSGLAGDWNTAYYNVSKGAVVNLTRTLALDHGADGVRTNSVCPSVVETPMTAERREDQAFVQRMVDRVPMKRLARPDDVAAAILFLASDDAAFINGVNLPVDGGTTASTGQAAF
ncbi:meso-2,3-butanediol dehydrogenase [Frateuria aurantia]